MDELNRPASGGAGQADLSAKLAKLAGEDRRVLGGKQTVGYMFFDGSRDFNIDGHKELFNDSILKISLPLQSRYNFFAGIWDIVDDFLVGGINVGNILRFYLGRSTVNTGGYPVFDEFTVFV